MSEHAYTILLNTPWLVAKQDISVHMITITNKRIAI